MELGLQNLKYFVVHVSQYVADFQYLINDTLCGGWFWKIRQTSKLLSPEGKSKKTLYE